MGWISGLFYSGSHKAEIKALAGLGTYVEALRATPLLGTFRFLAGFSSMLL